MGKLFLIPLTALVFLMGKFIVKEIRDNYPLYSTLLDNRKSIKDSVIDIANPKPSNKNFLINDKIIAKHITLSKDVVFISEVKVRNYKSFGFKLRCNELCQTPFFRYDSDGPAHRNFDENLSFEDQQVQTPHFNRFNKDGVSIAYQTKELKDAKSKVALEDINLCVVHFCNESNVRVKKNDFPSITILSKTLGLTLLEDDPNAGVHFI
ncbi:MAG TPA: hypothetical protein VKT28_13080 [Puia sp.]|nr:hypothetical protein [Puia sp.]